MFYLKLALVILFCLPVLYFGFFFASKLMDNAIASRDSRKKG